MQSGPYKRTFSCIHCTIIIGYHLIVRCAALSIKLTRLKPRAGVHQKQGPMPHLFWGRGMSLGPKKLEA